MELEELLRQIRRAWPTRYQHGRILHIHAPHVQTETGSVVNVRVLVQTVMDPRTEQED